MALSKSIRRADVHKTHGRGAGGGGAGAVTKLGRGHYLAPQVGQHCKKPG